MVGGGGRGPFIAIGCGPWWTRCQGQGVIDWKEDEAAVGSGGGGGGRRLEMESEARSRLRDRGTGVNTT
jgi:hypothetical protein